MTEPPPRPVIKARPDDLVAPTHAQVDPRPTAVPTDDKTAAVASILVSEFAIKPANILVVGCGTGTEAQMLARFFGAAVTGIDVEDHFEAAAAAEVNLMVADATVMPFADQAFDLVYSYHALEHIPDFRAALRQMRRVLKSGGCWCVGTPNRARLVGYLGSKDATIAEKLRWNMGDWNMRLRGKFRNEFGAHAGFTSAELSSELGAVFDTVQEITRDYYDEIYPRHHAKLAAMRAAGIAPFALPSVYFAGLKS